MGCGKQKTCVKKIKQMVEGCLAAFMLLALFIKIKNKIYLFYFYGKSWQVGKASRNETNEILTVYLVKRSALYTGGTDQDDL